MAEEIHLRDEDRLPWLETVDSDDAGSRGVGRVLLFMLLGLALLAAIVFAVLRLAGGPHPVADGGGALIQPGEGDYKIKPTDPGGLHVQGEGDTAVATSTGAGPNGGHIDAGQVPEKPVAGQHGAPATQHGGPVAAVPASGGKLTAPAPPQAPSRPVPGAASGGSLIQLGAFPSPAAANAAWSALAKRFSYVATLGKDVQQADLNGRHIYRLRVNAGSAGAAADICGRLKVAGEECFVATA